LSEAEDKYAEGPEERKNRHHKTGTEAIEHRTHRNLEKSKGVKEGASEDPEGLRSKAQIPNQVRSDDGIGNTIKKGKSQKKGERQKEKDRFDGSVPHFCPFMERQKFDKKYPSLIRWNRFGLR
jgi:hypothetical protein